MSERKWTVEDDGQPGYLDGIMAQFLVYDAATAPVAYCFDKDEAHLIAAAPDMLGALIQVRARFQHFNLGPDEAATFRRVDDALAKARGES